MQWKFVRTKLLLAGLALILLAGDSMARPGDRLFGRRNNGNQPVYQDAATAQPTTTAAVQPVQPATTVTTGTTEYMTSARRGLFGRRNGGQAMTTSYSPVASTPVAAAPAATTTPVASATTTTAPQMQYVRRGLFGRRGTWQEAPLQVQNQPAQPAQPPAATGDAAAERMPAPTPAVGAVTTQQQVPQYQTVRTGLLGRRTQQVLVANPTTPYSINPANGVRQSFYPGPAGSQLSYIDVVLPVPTAEVAFNGDKTTQSGLNRLFVTPALDPQRGNLYEVTARWTENGNPVEQKREIKIAPGTRVLVDFTQPQR